MFGPPEPSQARGQVAIDSDRQLVLRLWQSDIVLGAGADPLWIGNVTLQRQRHILFLRLPVTVAEYDAPLEKLMESLSGIEQRIVSRSMDMAGTEPRWDGRVLLIRGD